jgi:poly(A) polymerase
VTALPPSFEPVLTATRPISERFAAAGHRLYLVGGVVRDRLLGLPMGPDDDIDCTTDAEPEAIHRIVRPVADAVWLQGAAFGTVGCRVDGRAFEITTHRAEQYRTASRKPVVAYSSDITSDLSRRDFTVNSMAVSLPDGTLVDPFGGRADLAARTLRTPVEPAVSFDDDPLRMLRAARFIALLGLTPVEALGSAVAERADRMTIVSAERVHDELRRLLGLPAPSAGLRFLQDTGVLRFVLPEPAALSTADMERVLAAVDAVDLPDAEERILTRFVVALCGAGLPDRTAWEDRLARHVTRHADHLRWSRRERALAAALARELPGVVLHTEVWTAPELRAALGRAGASGVSVELLVRAARAAAVASGSPDAPVAAFADAVARHLAVEGMPAPPPLRGDEVMALLDVGPGEVVGRALAELRRLEVERGPMDAATARAALRAWWDDEGSADLEPD